MEEVWKAASEAVEAHHLPDELQLIVFSFLVVPEHPFWNPPATERLLPCRAVCTRWNCLCMDSTFNLLPRLVRARTALKRFTIQLSGKLELDSSGFSPRDRLKFHPSN